MSNLLRPPRFGILVSFCMLLAGSLAASAQTVELSGIVIDSVSGAPIPRVTVSAHPPDANLLDPRDNRLDSFTTNGVISAPFTRII